MSPVPSHLPGAKNPSGALILLLTTTIECWIPKSRFFFFYSKARTIATKVKNNTLRTLIICTQVFPFGSLQKQTSSRILPFEDSNTERASRAPGLFWCQQCTASKDCKVHKLELPKVQLSQMKHSGKSEGKHKESPD